MINVVIFATMCKYACIAHLTLFSDVKRQTRWGQVTLLSHLIIKSWPLQHISLHSGTRGKYLTSCNDCMWQLVGRSDTGKWLAGQYLYLPAGQLTRWKQKCSRILLAPAPGPSCGWMFVNWHSVDTRGQWIILSTLHSQLGTIQDMMSCPGHCRPARTLMSAFVAAGSSGSEYLNYFKQRAVQASHQGLSECPVLASRAAGQQGTGGGQVSVFGPGLSTSNKQCVCLWTHLY